MEKIQHEILKEQTELKELINTYQKLIYDEMKIIVQQTKDKQETNFLNVNKFLFLSNILISY